MFKGIDISTYQKPKNIDYDKLSKEIDFAILRVGYTGWGSGNSYHDDDEFQNHYRELSKRDVPLGVYWYSCANTVEEGKAEAKEVLKRIKGLKLEYPIYWDTEDNHHQRNTKKQILTDTAKAFCDEIEKAGYYVGIYASSSWLNNQLDMNQLKQFDVWVAHYGVRKPSYDKPYGMWQWTSKGRLNGYPHNLDLNIAYKDYKSIMYAHGLNGLKKNDDVKPVEPKPVEPPKPTPPKPKEIIHTVVKGDTLWDIGKKYGKDYKKIYEDNKKVIGKDPNLIKPRMKLIIK